MNKPLSFAVGQSAPQIEAQEKVSGSAQYIADLYRPNMLYGALLQSPHAHARIVGHDISQAAAMPGVHAIITGDDLQEHWRMGAFIKDEHALAKGKVRYVGEPVAAVAAETETLARAAAAAIEVTYEELPAALSPQEALSPDAAVIHEHAADYIKVFDAGTNANLCSRTSFQEGDIQRGWRESDLIFEASYQTQPQAHVSLEPCGALAEMDANGRVSLWSANQSVFRVQANVAESLGLPMSRLRCLTPKIGAGFGNKMEPHVQPIVVLLAMKAKRPVKLILTREQDFEMVRARHPFQIGMKTGVKRDGTLVAREVEVLLDGGAFGRQSGRARLFAVDELRPLPHPACSLSRPPRLHQQNAVRRIPRLRRSAGHVRRRDADGRDRRRARSRSDRIPPEESQARGRLLAWRAANRIERRERMPGESTRRLGLEQRTAHDARRRKPSRAGRCL
jgi:CO/xanthine dehydrogenase Mo-binding subunit